MLVQANKHSSGGHRGRFDIIADILETSYGGTRKTYLMYHCNLSFRQLKYYLDFLIKRELLCGVGDNSNFDCGLFKVTDKGKEFLKVYKGLKALME